MNNCRYFACVYAGRNGCHIKGYLTSEGTLNGKKEYCQLYDCMCVNSNCNYCMRGTACDDKDGTKYAIEKLNMSEEEAIKHVERIAKNLEEMKEIALRTPPPPLRRFVAITTLQNEMNKAFVYDNEADYRLPDDVLTKWIEIGINVRNAFDECEKDCYSGSEHVQKFKDWLKQVNA